MISNQAPEGPAGTLTTPGRAGAAGVRGGPLAGRLRTMNVGVLREAALLPVLALSVGALAARAEEPVARGVPSDAAL